MQTRKLTDYQCRMARAALRWTLDDLSERSGIGRATVARLEGGDRIKLSTQHALRIAFEAAGIAFVNEENGTGVTLKSA